MKNNATSTEGTQSGASPAASRRARQSKIHPVVIYPFRQPGHYSDLEELYRLIARLDADKDTYARPITVVDRKTHLAMEGDDAFLNFRKNTVARHSDILDEWCVDTCQMWYSGLGKAFEKGGPEDVYWLVSGRSAGNPPVHRAAPFRVLRPPARLFARGAAAPLVCLRADRGHVVACRVHPPTHQPLFRRQYFRPARRTRILRLGPAAGGTNGARPQITLARTQPAQGRLARAIPGSRRPIGTGSPNSDDHS